jgi:hypothetical protein
MMKPKKANPLNFSIFLALACLFFSNCGTGKTNEGQTSSEPKSSAEFSALADQAINDAQKVLLTKLTEAIGIHGFEGAIDFCHDRALILTDSVADVYGVSLRRISDKFRNSEDQAGNDELELIRSYSEKKANGSELSDVYRPKDDGGYIMYRPIILGSALCLSCHGAPEKEIAPSTLNAIHKHYPQDLAVGYVVGDIRGIWKVQSK